MCSLLERRTDDIQRMALALDIQRIALAFGTVFVSLKTRSFAMSLPVFISLCDDVAAVLWPVNDHGTE